MRPALALLAALAAGPAAAEPPRYLIAIWDGRATAPGAWFTVDAATLADGVALSPVRSLPQGVVIEAEAGRLALSSDLARLLGVAPQTPTLIEVTRPGDRLGPSPAGLDSDLAAAADAASDDYAARVARVGALLAALREEAARSVAADAGAARAVVAADAPPIERPAAGGLVWLGGDG